MNNQIPLVVVRRLSRYYRHVSVLLDRGVLRVSSSELGTLMGVTASQIRQDLNYFGGFGQKGYGYNVAQLHAAIANILGLTKRYTTIIIGAGNLGAALAKYSSFERRGFTLIGIFDNNPRLHGKRINGIDVMDVSGLEAFCAEHKPNIAMLALPSEAAMDIAARLSRLRISGIWNFSHIDLHLNFPDISVENVHLSDSLMTLSYMITNNPDKE